MSKPAHFLHCKFFWQFIMNTFKSMKLMFCSKSNNVQVPTICWLSSRDYPYQLYLANRLTLSVANPIVLKQYLHRRLNWVYIIVSLLIVTYYKTKTKLAFHPHRKAKVKGYARLTNLHLGITAWFIFRMYQK